MTTNTIDRLRKRMIVATNPRIWVLAVYVVILAATNAGFAQAPLDDAIDYRHIASAAPGLPPDRIGSAFTARFAIHYLVGVIARLSTLSVDAIYGVAFIVLICVLLTILFALFARLDVLSFSICTALFILNPYSVRPYVLQPETLQDIVFVIGLGICLLGLRNRSSRVIVTALVIAVLGRQTALLVAPVAAIWILVDTDWRRDRGRRRPWPTALAFLAVTVALYAGIRVWSARFSMNYEPTGLHDTVLSLVAELPGSAVELVEHFERTAIPLVVPFAIFCALVIVMGRRNVPTTAWCSALMAAAIAAQPAAVDPRFPGFLSNEQRLAALAILPLVYAVGELLCETRPKHANSSRSVWIPVLIAAASLHHEFTSVGPHSLIQFIVLQLSVAAVAAALIVSTRRRRDLISVADGVEPDPHQPASG